MHSCSLDPWALPAEEAARRGVTRRGLKTAAARASRALTGRGGLDYGPHRLGQGFAPAANLLYRRVLRMKIKNSLRALRKRHRNNRVVRRRGRLYVINKTNRRYKARQG